MIEIIPLKEEIDAAITAPPSKSHTLRSFFIAALAQGTTKIKNPLIAEDQLYAIAALEKFGVGVKIQNKKQEITITGAAGKLKLPSAPVFIGNSGVTARFLAAFAGLAPPGKIIIDGDQRMRKGRPIQDLLHGLAQLGVEIKSIYGNNCLPIEAQGGTFIGGTAKLKGSISSQYFSSILISAPCAQKDVRIKCIGRMSSRPYIDITIDMMRDFGVKAQNDNYKTLFVGKGQKYIGRTYKIEGDYSNASYFFAAAAICGKRIRIKNLKKHSKQGDKIFPDILQKMGCKVKKKVEEIELIKTGRDLRAVSMDMNSYPDLVPTLAVVAAFAKGTTELYNIAHLRFKECDRLKAVANELKKIGVEVKQGKDRLIIKGQPDRLHKAYIDCYNDHRMAMAFSIAGLKIPGIIIKDEKCVRKSFVDFYKVFRKIGGRYKK